MQNTPKNHWLESQLLPTPRRILRLGVDVTNAASVEPVGAIAICNKGGVWIKIDPNRWARYCDNMFQDSAINNDQMSDVLNSGLWYNEIFWTVA